MIIYKHLVVGKYFYHLFINIRTPHVLPTLICQRTSFYLKFKLKWDKTPILKFLQDNNDDAVVITIARLFLRNRQAKNIFKK